MTESIALDSIVLRDESLLTQELEGDLVIANLESGNYYGLGSSGKRIWDLIETPLSVQGICEVLINEYEVDRTTCERDVLAFVATLLERGVVRIRATRGAASGA